MFRTKKHFVAFSGPDGSGKSTQIALLKAEFERRGQKPVVVWTRLGYTPGFENAKVVLRKMLGRKLPQRGASTQRTEMMGRSWVRHLWLACAIVDLLFTAAVRVRVQTWRGRSVICDRWVWDSFIDRRLYHKGAPWADRVITPLFAAFGAKPDLAIVLMLPFEQSKLRSEAKDEPFPDPPDIRAARHLEYEALAKDPKFATLDASRPPAEIAARIVALL